MPSTLTKRFGPRSAETETGKVDLPPLTTESMDTILQMAGMVPFVLEGARLNEDAAAPETSHQSSRCFQRIGQMLEHIEADDHVVHAIRYRERAARLDEACFQATPFESVVCESECRAVNIHERHFVTLPDQVEGVGTDPRSELQNTLVSGLFGGNFSVRASSDRQ